MLDPWKESYDKPRQHIKKQRHHFADTGPYNQSYDFSSSHVQMCELDHKEGWALKNWCFQIVILENILESPLDWFPLVSPKGCWCWSWSWSSNTFAIWCEELTYWKRPRCRERLKIGGEGDDRRWDGWMASPTDGPEFEQVLGVGDGQGSLVCCSPWGRKELDTTEGLNWLTVQLLPFLGSQLCETAESAGRGSKKWNRYM